MKVLKKIFTVCGVIAILIVGLALAMDRDSKPTGNTSGSTSTTSTTVDKKPTITKAEFDKIENGMTYEEVSKIIGGPGEVLSETGQKGDSLYTVMYMWEGEGSTGANANFMFQGGKLQSKAQMGLK